MEKKQKKEYAKVIVISILIVIFTILIVRIVTDIDVEFLDNYTDEEISAFVNNIVDHFYYIMFCIYATMSTVLLYFTYRRIKKQVY